MAALYEMRIGRSGYLLTGDEETLAPFARGASSYPAILDRLESLTASPRKPSVGPSSNQ